MNATDIVGTSFAWCTTSPNPRSPQTGYDAGQRGWRLHAVPMQDGEEYQAYKRRPALCGLWPRHGWGVDLFIEDECARCSAAMDKREAAGETFTDLAVVWRARREAKQQQEAAEYRAARKAAGTTATNWPWNPTEE